MKKNGNLKIIGNLNIGTFIMIREFLIRPGNRSIIELLLLKEQNSGILKKADHYPSCPAFHGCLENMPAMKLN